MHYRKEWYLPKLLLSEFPYIIISTLLHIPNNLLNVYAKLLNQIRTNINTHYYLSGFSHSPDYQLFRIGDVASAAVQEFAETGSTSSFDILPTESSSTNATNSTVSEFDKDSILDGFTAPPIESGIGMAQSNIFLDGNHSMVSHSNLCADKRKVDNDNCFIFRHSSYAFFCSLIAAS